MSPSSPRVRVRVRPHGCCRFRRIPQAYRNDTLKKNQYQDPAFSFSRLELVGDEHTGDDGGGDDTLKKHSGERASNFGVTSKSVSRRQAVTAGFSGGFGLASFATLVVALEAESPPSAYAYGLERPPPRSFNPLGDAFSKLPKKKYTPSTSNLEEAKEKGERLREERAEAENPGELVTMPSGLQYREISTGTKGPVVQKGDVVEFTYIVYRLSSGAYFKYSSGGRPVLLYSYGYGNEGQNDVGDTWRATLNTKDLPLAASAAMVGMRRGGRRRILIPPQFGWTDNAVGPKPQTFGAYRRLEQHKDEPLLFEVEVARVLPGGREVPDEEALPEDTNTDNVEPLYKLPAPPTQPFVSTTSS